MKKYKFRTGAPEIALLVLCALFLAGILCVFGACSGTKDDGSYMSCHYAWITCCALAAVLTVQSLAHFLVPSLKMRAGIAAGMIPVCILLCIVPGNLIGLCMMSNMACNSVMRPAVTVFSVIIAVVAAVDIVVQLRRKEQ